MTYLIITVAILSLAEVFTLTLLKRRKEDIRYYQSETYKNDVFKEKAFLNSKRWSELNGGRLK